jgi:hypothetical protein
MILLVADIPVDDLDLEGGPTNDDLVAPSPSPSPAPSPFIFARDELRGSSRDSTCDVASTSLLPAPSLLEECWMTTPPVVEGST